MKAFTCWISIMHIGLIYSFTLFQKPLLKRLVERNHLEDSNIQCVHMESLAGEYWFTSTGTEDVCGLYIIGLPDQLIQLEFTDFNIDCNSGGLLAVVDGWELQGQYFPSAYDHPKSDMERYLPFCGEDRPQRPILLNQNAALIQYRIPTPGQGFRVRVSMPQNPRPCNVVSMVDEGTFTLQNFGLKVNCSMSIVYPEVISILNLNVGQNAMMESQTKDTGLTLKCEKRGREDYVQLLDGNTLDPRTMWKEASICGLASKPVPTTFPLGCQHSVVRLVSSGKYYNSVTFTFTPPTESDSNPDHLLSC